MGKERTRLIINAQVEARKWNVWSTAELCTSNVGHPHHSGTFPGGGCTSEYYVPTMSRLRWSGFLAALGSQG